jgi:hypothetical protein
MMKMRSFVTIAMFLVAAGVALVRPSAAMVLICACLFGYLRPDVPAGGATPPANKTG